MAFNFITLVEGVVMPSTAAPCYTADTQTNITYALVSSSAKVAVNFSIGIDVNGQVTPIIPDRQVPAGGTDLCNELKGLILQNGAKIVISAKQQGLYFRANGFSLS